MDGDEEVVDRCLDGGQVVLWELSAMGASSHRHLTIVHHHDILVVRAGGCVVSMSLFFPTITTTGLTSQNPARRLSWKTTVPASAPRVFAGDTKLI